MAIDETEPGADENSVRISMLLEKQLLEAVDKAAGRYGLPRSTFIRQSLVKALREVAEEPDWADLMESTKSPFYYDIAGIATRFRHVGYISPKGLRVIRQKLHNRVGPAEALQGLPSPYEQLLRKLGVTAKKVEEAIRTDNFIPLRPPGE